MVFPEPDHFLEKIDESCTAERAGLLKHLKGTIPIITCGPGDGGDSRGHKVPFRLHRTPDRQLGHLSHGPGYG